MEFWLVQTGEPLPPPLGASRLWRTGLLARALTGRGHDVRWLTSEWDHFSKRRHAGMAADVHVPGVATLVFAAALGYHSTFSPRRLLDHAYVAWTMAQITKRKRPPDAVLASVPTIESAFAMSAYAARERIPFVVDVRDQWPDVIWDLCGPWTRPIVRRVGGYLDVMARRTFARAAAITGNGEGAVEWAIDKAGRGKRDADVSFPMAYDHEPPRADQQAALERWRAFGIDPERPGFIVVYAGVMNTKTRDLDTVIEAAARLSTSTSADIKFVLCGSGEDQVSLRDRAAGLRNVVIAGWVDNGPLQALLSIAKAGLNPSRPLSNFETGVTNKPIEYLAAGLPVVTTISRGELWDEMARAGCASGYRAGNSLELADRILQLASDRHALAQQSQAARTLFKRRYDADLVYAEMATWLEQVTADSRLARV